MDIYLWCCAWPGGNDPGHRTFSSLPTLLSPSSPPRPRPSPWPRSPGGWGWCWSTLQWIWMEKWISLCWASCWVGSERVLPSNLQDRGEKAGTVLWLPVKSVFIKLNNRREWSWSSSLTWISCLWSCYPLDISSEVRYEWQNRALLSTPCWSQTREWWDNLDNTPVQVIWCRP